MMVCLVNKSDIVLIMRNVHLYLIINFQRLMRFFSSSGLIFYLFLFICLQLNA